MKTSELTEAALDWAVAKAEGATDEWRDDGPFWWDGVPCIRSGGHDVNYRPSIDWSQGGPIIERKRLCVYDLGGDEWGCDDNLSPQQTGPTPLIAAMRCYVASKLGDEVEIPRELI